MLSFRRTRLAPTPSGFLHPGNILSFILTAGLARQTGAKILLRIDDLDRERFREEYLEDIFDSLRFLGIPWDEGPANSADFHRSYSQSGRSSHYITAISRLHQTGSLFGCRCSRKELSETGSGKVYPGTCQALGLSIEIPEICWRLNALTSSKVTIRGLNGDTAEQPFPQELQMAVIVRKDGIPSYQLASVVDDVLFDIDLIVRGEDLRSSTLFQVALSQILGEERLGRACFVHHPLLTNSAGGKLSKTAGSGSIALMRREGLSHEAIFQQLAAMAGIDAIIRSWQDMFPLLARRWLPENGF